MRSQGNLKMAIASVRSTKWRSLLTMLGIIIGISSVVTVIGIGEGVKHQVAGQVSHFGPDLITIRPGHVATTKSSNTLTSGDSLFGLSTVSGLTSNDLHTIQNTDKIKLAAPLGVVPGAVQAGDRKWDNPLVLATNDSIGEALNQSLPYGDLFDGKDGDQNIAVIGRNVAANLFGEDVPLGESFTLRGETFTVRGIFANFQGGLLSPTANFNDAIFIPYKTAQRVTNGSVQFYTILAKPDNTKDLKPAIQNIDASLNKTHGGQHDYTVMNRDQAIASSSNIVNLLSTMITGVAAISLLVGGIGIMNIMLVSVTERLHEIGVRKAIGATPRQIMKQFMLEAIVLSSLGGVLGVIVSLVTDLLLHAYTNLKPVISWRAIVVATAVSVVIGIVFGTAPAVKAARKDPIQALRHE